MSTTPYTGLPLSTLAVCSTILHDRIATSESMLVMHRKIPGVLPLEIVHRYCLSRSRALAQMEQLHREFESRIAAKVNL